MSGLRGFYQYIIAPLIGGLLGVIVAWSIVQNANLKVTSELYLADMASINMFYQSRNMQEYLELGEDWLVQEFVESGGPRDCGEPVNVSGRKVSVWKTSSCEIPELDPGGVSLNESARIIEKELRRYEGMWGVSSSSTGESFCLEYHDTLPFAKYDSEVCFQTNMVAAIESIFGNMTLAYETGSATCACLDTYQVCWVDVEGYNFTYALMENC